MKKSNEHPLSELLEAFERHPKFKDKIYLEKLKDWWRTEMPRSFSEHVQVSHVRSGKLYLKVSSSVIRHELMISQEALIKKMNDVLQDDYVKKISFG